MSNTGGGAGGGAGGGPAAMSMSFVPALRVPISENDLIDGRNEWCNIQEVVRTSVRFLLDTVRTQHEEITQLRESVRDLTLAMRNKADVTSVGEMIGEVRVVVAACDRTLRQSHAQLERQLAEKASAYDVSQQLARKVDTTEFTKMATGKANAEDVRLALTRKPDWDEIETVLDQKADKQRVFELLNRKADLSEVSQALTAAATISMVTEELNKKVSQQQLAQVMEKKASVDDLVEGLRRKADRSEVAELRAVKANIDDVNCALSEKASKQSVAAALHKKAAREEIEVLQAALAGKCSREELDDRVQTISDRASAQLGTRLAEHERIMSESVHQSLTQLQAASVAADTAIESRLRQFSTAAQEAIDGLQTTMKRVDEAVRDMQENKANVQDLGMYTKHSEFTPWRTLVQTIQARYVDHDALLQQMRAKADATETSAVLARKADVADVDRLRADVDQRALTADVCAVLDRKVDIDAVNSTLARVASDLDARVPLAEYTKRTAAIESRLQLLNLDECVGRWIWKSGKVARGNLVPWNVQTVNTHPENFVWEEDKPALVIATPGLYEVTFAFFARKKPTVQLLVNNEPIISALNSASYVVHHSSGRLAPVGPHSAGCVSGMSMIDFLALPPLARLSVVYQGEAGVEGFLGLRKL